MPIVTVLQGPRDLELKRALVASITEAFVDSCGVPAESVQIWIRESSPENLAMGGVLIADRQR